MAVPKKKTSKARKRQRKSAWMHQGQAAAAKALSLAKSILTGRSKGFVYPQEEEDSESEG
ncbi:MAG: 50S ribosomal protein L32 [Gloeomargaritaceae cyanobacterium C42_A2020_066]|nr:50S ribosomal protein L32 [Gloeomargaritaceae cyanobacterium C42_A2020_066]